MKNKLITSCFNLLASLPLGLLYLFSDFITLILYYIVRYRRKVVRKNLTDSFPEKSKREIKKIERGFYRYLGDQIVETLKLLNISDEELRRRIKVNNPEFLNSYLSQGKNVVVLMGHYSNWEWVQELCRYLIPESYMMSIYHPLNHQFWNELFIKLRGRWGAHIVAMQKAPRVLLSKEHRPWVCGFIADAYTWHKNDDNWVEFLNHKTWFIYGPEEIGKKTSAEFVYLEMNRIKRGHYEINLSPLLPSDFSQPYPYSREFWKKFENTIKEKPAFWLWSHKRWK